MANGKFEFVQHGIERDKVVQTNCTFASYCRWKCALKKGNTLFNAGFVLPHSGEIDLGFLPFDRKFRKFRMEGKWNGHFSEIPTEN